MKEAIKFFLKPGPFVLLMMIVFFLAVSAEGKLKQENHTKTPDSEITKEGRGKPTKTYIRLFRG